MFRQNGFTLVEVLIVSVIVAVLAIVAVPVYKGYVRSTNMRIAEDLGQITSAKASAYYSRHNKKPPSTDILNMIYDSSHFKISIDTTNNKVEVYKDSGTTEEVKVAVPVYFQ